MRIVIAAETEFLSVEQSILVTSTHFPIQTRSDGLCPLERKKQTKMHINTTKCKIASQWEAEESLCGW